MRLGAIFFNSIAFSVQLHKEIQQTVVVRFIFHSVPISVVSPTLQRIINLCVCLFELPKPTETGGKKNGNTRRRMGCFDA